MKLIAVTPDYLAEKNLVTIKHEYFDLIRKNGAIPVLLPFIDNEEAIDLYIDRFDGFLITGGADVSPRLYGEDKLSSCGFPIDRRDSLEYKLIRRLYEEDKPVLGICRGLQMMNVALGGSLYQDLKSQMDTDIVHSPEKFIYDLSHLVVNEENTLFSKVFEGDFYVNSMHHQAIKDLASGLKVGQRSRDGVIEAIYAPDKQFFAGIQWHLEMYPSDLKEYYQLMKAFLDSIR